MGDPSDSSELPATGVALAAQLIQVAGENPDAKQAGRELGKSALTVAKTINVVLLPLAAVNYGMEKAKNYFANPFAQELAGKAASIPLEHIVEPMASVAGPALQGLAFSHEEPNLKEMYLNLLTTAMDGRKKNNAHPAFVEIIKQLTSEEAQVLQDIVPFNVPFPIVELRGKGQEPGWRTLYRHLMAQHDKVTKEPTADSRLPAMIDNWIRLGLVEVSYDVHITQLEAYNWVEQSPEYKRCLEVCNAENRSLRFAKGCLSLTSFGQEFAKAVGLREKFE